MRGLQKELFSVKSEMVVDTLIEEELVSEI